MPRKHLHLSEVLRQIKVAARVFVDLVCPTFQDSCRSRKRDSHLRSSGVNSVRRANQIIGLIPGKVGFPAELKYLTSRILLEKEAALPAQPGRREAWLQGTVVSASLASDIPV